jgi:asparagine synthase (glutamine-hydrolysing)
MGAVHGIVGLPVAASTQPFRDMRDTLDFRGRDSAEYIKDGIAFGVVRHSHETQPCLVSNDAGTVIAVCEGELYNAADLAQSIGMPRQALGFDVVPWLFEKNGKDFAREMNGVFGVALFDLADRTLYLVRDHAGSHSLFYSPFEDGVQFATTTRALFASGLAKREISQSALDAYLACLAVSPPETMFRNVFALRPGHAVIIKEKEITEYAYWPFHRCIENRTRSEDDFASEIRSIFVDAVKIRMTYPGKFGALISGGVDTSAIAAVLGREFDQAFDGFSVVFEERAYSDEALQQLIYRDPKIRKRQIMSTPNVFRDALVAGIEHLDSPVNDVAYAGMYAAMQAVSGAGLDAVFEGEGADEIFCTGHSHGELSVQPFLVVPEPLRRAIMGAMFQNMPIGGSLADKVRRFGCRLGMPTHKRLSTWVPIMHDTLRCALHTATAYTQYPYPQTRYYLAGAAVKDPVNLYNYLLSRMFLADDLLYKNERMAAAHGVTNRTPFVDYRLMELAFTVPANFKIQKPTATADMTKLIFKRAMKDIVPDEILTRKKTRGFSQPTRVWYRGPLKDFTADLLLAPSNAIGSYLDGSMVRQIFDDHVTGKANLDYHLSSLLLLELWLRSNG